MDVLKQVTNWSVIRHWFTFLLQVTSSSLLGRSIMLRRQPTRLELGPEDVIEYSTKKEAERKSKMEASVSCVVFVVATHSV